MEDKMKIPLLAEAQLKKGLVSIQEVIAEDFLLAKMLMQENLSEYKFPKDHKCAEDQIFSQALHVQPDSNSADALIGLPKNPAVRESLKYKKEGDLILYSSTESWQKGAESVGYLIGVLREKLKEIVTVIPDENFGKTHRDFLAMLKLI